MTFQQSLFGYAFQAGVLVQPLVWMWLHGSKWVLPDDLKTVFYTSSMIAAVFVHATRFSIGFYNSDLIIQYIVFTVLAVYFIDIRHSFKEALCLGFLVVFLNSYYWEAPLHLAEILNWNIHAEMLIQLWRLAPIPFLLQHYTFPAYTRRLLSLGLVVSCVVMLVRVYLRIRLWWFMPLNRFVCLLLLTKVVTEAEKK